MRALGALGAFVALAAFALKLETNVTGFLTMLAVPATAIVVTKLTRVESFMAIEVDTSGSRSFGISELPLLSS